MNELNALSLEPVGALRISLPAFMSSSDISTAIAEFIRLHPHVAVSATYSDRTVALIENGYDLSIRAGWLDDSSMMSRKLGNSQRALVAGTGYAALRPHPRHPSDMEDWDWIRYRQRSDITEFISPDGETAKVTGNARLEVDSVDALFHFACRNIGATIVPLHLAARGEVSGELVRLLPDWKLRPLGYYAVWPDKSRRENLTLLFVRFLADHQAC
ncbi:substrate binding domain-containing protein [Aurantimonas sp. A3-2-R12]|nr:substrate binding domain-containing protein [Aurantimonas sp. A3-2-R12]